MAFTPSFVKSFLAAARSTTAPDYAGQLAVETDTNLMYRATGTSAGAWQVINPATLIDFSGLQEGDPHILGRAYRSGSFIAVSDG